MPKVMVRDTASSPLAILLCLVLLLSACSKDEGDEAEIRGLLGSVAESARAKDLKGVMPYISEDYNDDDGNDHKGLRRLLFGTFFRYKSLSVFIRSTDVEVKDGVGHVVCKVTFLAGREVDSLDDIQVNEGSTYTFDIILRNEDGGWKVIRASWRESGLIGIL